MTKKKITSKKLLIFFSMEIHFSSIPPSLLLEGKLIGMICIYGMYVPVWGVFGKKVEGQEAWPGFFILKKVSKMYRSNITVSPQKKICEKSIYWKPIF